MTCIRVHGGIVCVQPEFKPGDQAPEGYLAWHEWAEVQHKAGFRQKQCGRCEKWKYPQELSDKIDIFKAKTRKGPVTVESPVCNECNKKQTPKAEIKNEPSTHRSAKSGAQEPSERKGKQLGAERPVGLRRPHQDNVVSLPSRVRR